MDLLRSLIRAYLPTSPTTTALLTASFVVTVLMLSSTVIFPSKNHFPVSGRTILLTGATEGLGRSAARLLASRGAHIAILARNSDRLEQTLQELSAVALHPSTQRFLAISEDVSSPGHAERVLSQVSAWNKNKPPDIIWCIAGMASPMLFADPRSDALAALRRNMDVNFFGAAEMARSALRLWLDPASPTPTQYPDQPRHIIFTASVLACFSVPGYATYTPTKHALRGLADTLAAELLLYPSQPVRVHVVLPGTILSPGLARENRTKPAVTIELEKDDVPQTPEEVAHAAFRGLQRGEYLVATSWLGELMRVGALSGSLRNSWLWDTVVGWLMPFVYRFVQWDFRVKLTRWARKYGHPSQYEPTDPQRTVAA